LGLRLKGVAELTDKTSPAFVVGEARFEEDGVKTLIRVWYFTPAGISDTQAVAIVETVVEGGAGKNVGWSVPSFAELKTLVSLMKLMGENDVADVWFEKRFLEVMLSAE